MTDRAGGRHAALHARIRERGASRRAHRAARVVLEPALRAWFRPRAIGWEHVPRRGPLIVAANHRHALDPVLLSGAFPEPLHHLAKAELFESRLVAEVLVLAGAFPVRRGERDLAAVETAAAVVRRGGIVLISPEGTRVRGGGLGAPRPGVGTLALTTGAPVLPVALRGGTEARGRLRRPDPVRAAFGPPVPAPVRPAGAPAPSREEAAAHTATVWASVTALWEHLGDDRAAAGPVARGRRR